MTNCYRNFDALCIREAGVSFVDFYTQTVSVTCPGFSRDQAFIFKLGKYKSNFILVVAGKWLRLYKDSKLITRFGGHIDGDQTCINPTTIYKFDNWKERFEKRSDTLTKREDTCFIEKWLKYFKL